MSLLTGALVMALTHSVGNAAFIVALPQLIGVCAATPVLTPLVGCWNASVSVAAVVGSLAALAAGLLLGERDVLALLSSAFAGVALGTALASVLRRARELVAPGRETAGTAGGK